MGSIAMLFFLLAMDGLILPNVAWGADAARACDKMSIVSLGIYPDPLADGGGVAEWSLRVRSDSDEVCRSSFQIVEVEREVVAAETSALIKSGANDIKLAPAPDYRLTGDTRCFNVVVAGAAADTKTETPKNFCALHIDKWWTMR
jgi:hypothetical protein